jgi:SAM-dependent methyltransferase
MAVAPEILPPLDFRTRLEAVELLDAGAGDEADAMKNLLEMARLNRYLGGVRAITCHLFPLLKALSHPVTILDVGTGSGFLLSIIARWAIRNQRIVRLVGLDLSGRNLTVAQTHGTLGRTISLLRADARCLPFPNSSVDYIISTLFLHHFNPPEMVELLRLSYAKARYGLLMSDLVRGELPYLAFKLIQPAFARHPFTRYDGALSIRRAYIPAEISVLTRAAGISGIKVYSHWPWRMTLVALKGNE